MQKAAEVNPEVITKCVREVERRHRENPSEKLEVAILRVVSSLDLTARARDTLSIEIRSVFFHQKIEHIAETRAEEQLSLACARSRSAPSPSFSLKLRTSSSPARPAAACKPKFTKRDLRINEDRAEERHDYIHDSFMREQAS